MCNEFGDWSPCTEECGGGTQSRTREADYTKGPETACPTAAATETRTCNVHDCASKNKSILLKVGLKNFKRDRVIVNPLLLVFSYPFQSIVNLVNGTIGQPVIENVVEAVNTEQERWLLMLLMEVNYAKEMLRKYKHVILNHAQVQNHFQKFDYDLEIAL